MLCEECLPPKIIFKDISPSLYMHYFLLPAIALMHVLLEEKSLNTYNVFETSGVQNVNHTSLLILHVLLETSLVTQGILVQGMPTCLWVGNKLDLPLGAHS